MTASTCTYFVLVLVFVLCCHVNSFVSFLYLTGNVKDVMLVQCCVHFDDDDEDDVDDCDSLDITLVAQVHNISFLISIYTICTCLKKRKMIDNNS